MRRAAAVVVVCCALALAQSTTEARFTPVFENAEVAVFSLELPERSRATVYQGTHDVIWLALNDASVNFGHREGSDAASLHAGDTRFFSAFRLASISNDRGNPSARGVLIELKTRGLASSGCACGTATERALCGCPGAGHMPELWAFSLGQVTLGGTLLRTGESFQGSSYRNNMLLVAVTALDLRDQAAESAVRLDAGQARWIPAGPHQFQNLGSAAARFLTVEF